MSQQPLERHSASNRLLVNAILGQTSALVRDALSGDWRGAVAAAQQRRRLLARLEPADLRHASAAVLALRQAVMESDRALAVIESLQLVPASEGMLG